MLREAPEAVVVFLLLALAPFFAQSEPTKTGLNGTVVFSPDVPGAQRVGERTASSLSGALVEVRDAQGAVIAHQVTDAQGQFKVLVPAGRYEIQVHLRGSPFPRCPTTDATVLVGEFAHVDIECDSGMR